MLIDSHCHLDYPDLFGDLDQVMDRAREQGVAGMVTISTRLSTFKDVRAIAEARNNVWCSVGIHPHEAEAEGPVAPETLAALADHPKVVGIGETGLDFYYENSPREAQAESFRNHLRAAIATGLPAIVHTRSADEETARILGEEAKGGDLKGVIHCFSTGRALAEAALALGFYISISGIVTFKKAAELQEIVKDLPLGRLLVETDAPYLAPVPKRGKPNEPSYVAYTAAKVAEIKGVSETELAAATTENFFCLFSKARLPAGSA